MMRLVPTLAAGALLVGLGWTSASAAPALPQPGLVAGGMVETVRHRHHHWHRHPHSTKAERRARRLNTHRHGDPNAKNPALKGYQQNLGGTTGGPRY